MTTVAVILIGAGVILIASSLDNSSIVETFQKIINGDTINWTGTPAAQTAKQQGTSSGNTHTPQIQQTPYTNRNGIA